MTNSNEYKDSSEGYVNQYPTVRSGTEVKGVQEPNPAYHPDPASLYQKSGVDLEAQDHNCCKGQNTNYGQGSNKSDSNVLLEIIIAIFIPPLGVFLNRGCSGAFWLNLILTLFFFLPGLIHALVIILRSR